MGAAALGVSWITRSAPVIGAAPEAANRASRASGTARRIGPFLTQGRFGGRHGPCRSGARTRKEGASRRVHPSGCTTERSQHVRICLPVEDRRARACTQHDREDRTSRAGRGAGRSGAERAGPDGALPVVDHRSRGRLAADLQRRERARGQRRDLQLRGPAGDSRRERVRDPKRQRNHPAPVPHRGAALDRQARRHVRLRAGDAAAHRRGARSARHQAFVHGADRRGPGVRLRAEGVRRRCRARCRGDRPRRAVRQHRRLSRLVSHAAGCG